MTYEFARTLAGVVVVVGHDWHGQCPNATTARNDRESHSQRQTFGGEDDQSN